MDLQIIDSVLIFPWWCFFATLGLFVLCTIIMSRQSKHFLYMRGTAQTKFSMMELEFPGAPESISKIVNGMKRLPPDLAAKSHAALKANLLWDFLFMPGAYLSIFLLCMKIANMIDEPGRIIFVFLAWLQILAWLLDIIENYYLLHKLSHPYPARLSVHKNFRKMVSLKWATASAGVVSGLSMILYFWLMGDFGEAFGYAGWVVVVLFTLILIYSFYGAMKAVVGKEKKSA